MPRNALRHDKNATKRGCVSRRRRDAMRLHERQTIVPRIPRAIKKTKFRTPNDKSVVHRNVVGRARRCLRSSHGLRARFVTQSSRPNGFPFLARAIFETNTITTSVPTSVFSLGALPRSVLMQRDPTRDRWSASVRRLKYAFERTFTFALWSGRQLVLLDSSFGSNRV